MTLASSSGATSSCSRESSRTSSGGIRSGRVESSCPSLANVGPSSSSASRIADARVSRSAGCEPGRSPCRAKTRPIRAARRSSWLSGFGGTGAAAGRRAPFSPTSRTLQPAACETRLATLCRRSPVRSAHAAAGDDDQVDLLAGGDVHRARRGVALGKRDDPGAVRRRPIRRARPRRRSRSPPGGRRRSWPRPRRPRPGPGRGPERPRRWPGRGAASGRPVRTPSGAAVTGTSGSGRLAVPGGKAVTITRQSARRSRFSTVSENTRAWPAVDPERGTAPSRISPAPASRATRATVVEIARPRSIRVSISTL